MSRTLPNDDLLTRLAAWPFNSRHSYDVRLEHFDSQSFRAIKSQFHDIAWVTPEQLEGLATYAGASCANADNPKDCFAHLVELAQMYLRPQGADVVLREDGCKNDHSERPDLVERWRWLSFQLPPDLLIAALFAAGRGAPQNERVQLLSPGLSQLLSSEVAETHVHLSSAPLFGHVWQGWVAQMATSDFDPLAKRDDYKFPHCPFTLRHLRACFLARVYLGHWVQSDSSREKFTKRWMPDVEEQRVFGHALDLVSKGSEPKHLTERYPKGVEIGGLLRRLQLKMAKPTRLPAKSIEDLIALDPLKDFAVGKTLPETQFLTRLIAKALKTEDRQQKILALQYIRMRAQMYCWITQAPSAPGFTWFRDYFDRVKACRLALGKCRWEAAEATDSLGVKLGAFEGRVGPDDAGAEARVVEERVKKNASIERAILVHWPRIPVSSKPKDQAKERFFRNWGWYSAQMRDCRKLINALKNRPHHLRWIRGIDLCNIETSQPLWVTRLVLEDARSFMQTIAAETRLPMARTTIHVGEDFHRMVDGFRRVHELFEFGVLGVGDRIGHGTVLGTDIETWAANNRWLVQSKHDRLDDLLWEIARYQVGDLAAPASRATMIKREAYELGTHIYGDQWDLDHAMTARKLLHQTSELRRIGFQDNREVPAVKEDSPAQMLLRAYLTDRSVLRKGQEQTRVETKQSEVVFLGEAREWLYKTLGKWEVTLEANPSSNLVIAAFPKLEDHPLFRLAPLDLSEPHFAVSINTDNPLVFNTCLADEYAYLYAAMLRSGEQSANAIKWLERAKKAGWASRFTLPSPPSPPCEQHNPPTAKSHR